MSELLKKSMPFNAKRKDRATSWSPNRRRRKSPRPSSFNRQNQKHEQFDIKSLAEALFNLANSSKIEADLKVPEILVDTEPEHVTLFFAQLSQYRQDGGVEEATAFIDVDLLFFLCEMEIGKCDASSHEVLTYLKEIEKPKGFKEMHVM